MRENQIIMAPLKRIVLSAENAKEIQKKILSFFLRNSSPLHTHLFINCTLRKAVSDKGLVDHCKYGGLLRVLYVELKNKKDEVQIIMDTDNAGIPDKKHEPEHIFKKGMTFIFTDRKLYVKVPCTDYGKDNHFRYVIRVYEA